MTELQLVNKVREMLVAEGKTVYLEVPFLSRCIDMLIVQNDEVTSVEFKMRDWRKAIAQSREHLLGVDKAYVCLPHRKSITEKMRIEFENAGIGLLFFSEDNPPFKEMIPAKRSEIKWDISRRWLEEAIETHVG